MKQGAYRISLKHSDIEFVEGVLNKTPRIEHDFYNYCKSYFEIHYKSVFFTTETDREDIFQNAFITLWQNIERGKIRISDGVIVGNKGEKLQCSLTTYLMSIARNKYLELSRYGSDGNKSELPSDDELNGNEELIDDWLEEDYEDAMYEVISDSISVMPPKCSQLLTKFYYENKKLDDMLTEIPEYNSKDALKSNKNRCLNRLKTYAKQLYKIRKSK